MRPVEAGVELDAQFHAGLEDGRATLTIESRGGARGAPNERNTQYADGLRVLLRRLGARGVRITDAQVTSSAALRLYPDAAQRRLEGDFTYDIQVAAHDPDELRRAFGRAMRKAARDPDLSSSGNNNKRVTFWLAGPGTEDPVELERYLAADDVGRGTSSDRAGRVKPPSSPPHRQGYMADARARKAIEDRAMEAATAHWVARGFEVQDVSGNHPYDLLCLAEDGEEVHVEVKGTTGAGRTIHLTVGEVGHAREHRGRVALYVLHGIELSDSLEYPRASGGSPVVDEHWDVDAGTLRATDFDWSPPAQS